MWWQTVLCIVCASAVQCCQFPPGFKFGAATAAYQVEGAWNVSDKSENIWDNFVHSDPSRIADMSSGDVACDSYKHWKRDVEIAEELGLHFYRFSIGWTRLLPKGFANYVSEDGKRYYNDLIDALLEKGIEPVVTLYHWDLPQCLQDLGGWTNSQVSDWFADYARVAFNLFGDRVKTWLTLNEPVIFCEVPYNTGAHAPGVLSPGIGNYICNKNAMLAHAKAWRIYDEEFRHIYHGKISLTNQFIWFERADENEDEATEIAKQLMAMYTHPIFSKSGGWHPLIEKLVEEKSKEEGLTQSRLPAFTEEEIDFIKGTYDFFGLNYYTARTVRQAQADEVIALYWPITGNNDGNIVLSVNPDWESAATAWFYIYPEGLRLQIQWLIEQYGDIEIYIMENGYANYNSTLDDDDRVQYYNEHLEQILLAINEDRINVTRYTAWTMIDNFEWTDGYEAKFGLYQVDFEDSERTRHPRASAYYYSNVIKHHSLDIKDSNI
ncbi:unnamed protein product, partial [Brenthis ino]